MKRFLFGLAALPFLAGVSLAEQPVPLSDVQMDAVTAGFDFQELDIQNGGTVFVAINRPVAAGVAGPYLSISGTSYPAGVQSFQLQAQFGP
jgi:hypothetical protein